MKRLKKNGVAFLVLVSLLVGVTGKVGDTCISRAAEVTRYYIYLDQNEYEVTREQYEQI